MKTLHRTALSAIILLVFPGLSNNPAQAQEIPGSSTTLLGIVGQVTNSAAGVTPATSIQYGYLTYVRGVDQHFLAGGHDETSAIFTFFTSATTTGSVTTGNLRTVTRTGTTTLYLNPTPSGNFADPNTFRAGTPIQISTLQQQVVINVPTGTFRTVNVNAVTSSTQFNLAGRTLRLGAIGSAFTTFLVGQLHSPTPPSGYFSGYALEGRGTFSPTSPTGISAVPMLTTAGEPGVSASIVVSFNSASASDGMVMFGTGPGCAGLVEVATRDLFRHTTTHAVVVTGNDLPGTVGDNGIQPGVQYWYEVVTRGSGAPQTDDNQGACYQVTVPAS